jgi:hypothetical protein
MSKLDIEQLRYDVELAIRLSDEANAAGTSLDSDPKLEDKLDAYESTMRTIAMVALVTRGNQ